MKPAIAVVAVLSVAVPLPGAAALYKCVSAEGRVEYSNVPCGPTETVDYITGDTFSMTSNSRCPKVKDPAPPISSREIRRQQGMAEEAATQGYR
jgi:hypothetical protein